MLKNKLIHSIEILKHSQNPDSIKRLLTAIKDKDIQDNPLDYWKTLRLIFVIYLRWPNVRTDPDNRELIALGNECCRKAQSLMPQLLGIIHSLRQRSFHPTHKAK